MAPIGNQFTKAGKSLEFLVTATDPNGDRLTYSATNLPRRATFSGQRFSWTPTAGQAGTYQVTFTVSDGTLEDSELVTIAVTPVATGVPQTPWQTNAYGTLKTGSTATVASGFHFTPRVSGQITRLGGFFDGTKTVKLFEKATGTLLASAAVTAANSWGYTPITPVTVQPGRTYTVTVYLAGSGGTKRKNLSPPLPRTFGDITIKGTTSVDTSTNPNARPTNTMTDRMLGQADVVFVPSGPAP